MNRRSTLILVLIFVAGVFFRIYNFNYGLGAAYVSDTQTVSEAFDFVHNISQGDLSAALKPVKYPYVVPALIAVGHGPIVLWLWLGNQAHSLNDLQQRFLISPELSFAVSRFISVIAGSLLILLSFAVTRLLASRARVMHRDFASLMAAGATAFSFLLIQFSRTERPHIILGFFMLLSYWLYLRWLERLTWRSAVWLGIFTGLALGTLQSGILILLFYVPPLVKYIFKKPRIPEERTIFLSLFLCLMLGVLSYPHIIFGFAQALRDQGVLDITGSGGQHKVFPFTGRGFGQILTMFWGYERVLTVVGIFSLLAAMVMRQVRRFLTLDGGVLILFIIGFLALFGMYDLALPRYCIPLIVLLIPLSSLLTAYVITAFDNKFARSWFSSTLLVILIPIYLILPIKLIKLLSTPDTRVLATAWTQSILEQIPEHHYIALSAPIIDQQPSPRAIGVIKSWQGSVGRRDEALLKSGKPGWPLLSLWQLPQTKWPLALASSKYLIVSTEDCNEPAGALAPLIRNNWLRLKDFSPNNGKYICQAAFPGDLKNPWQELFNIERLGPLIVVYEHRP